MHKRVFEICETANLEYFSSFNFMFLEFFEFCISTDRRGHECEGKVRRGLQELELTHCLRGESFVKLAKSIIQRGD